MQPVAYLSAAVLLALALAGCAGQDAESQDTGDMAPSASGQGAVTGRVLDDEQAPVANATVALVEADRQTATDDSGDFSFDEVDVGTYTVAIEPVGYDAFAVSVDVVAGAASDLLIELVPIQVAVPYHTAIPFAGRFECSYALADYFWQGCAYPVHNTVFSDDTTKLSFRKDRGAVQLVNELRWQAGTAATGNRLDFNVVLDEREDCQWYANRFGPSPISITVTVGEVFRNPESPYPVGTCGDTIVDDLDTNLAILVYASPEYVGGQATGGLSVQQDFDGYNSVFYNQAAPAGYTALSVE